MNSIRNIYRIGRGPSSSHTMGPRLITETVKREHPDASAWRVTLYGSLAATGKGHLTDFVIRSVLGENCSIIWCPGECLPEHPNGMRVAALDDSGLELSAENWYSPGGGAIHREGEKSRLEESVYEHHCGREMLAWAEAEGKAIWQLAMEREDCGIKEFLKDVLRIMLAAVDRGLEAEGVLPGGLKLARKARSYFRKAQRGEREPRRTGLLSAYALAVAEENAAGGELVTAPTCGSCGVLPAVLRYLSETVPALSENDLCHALATAGLFGAVVRQNASISGAELGCQAEIGVACAMSAAAAAQLIGATPRQIEYAAEMGLEHHLGLTCDPVKGLVQIPCIERNAFAATRALDCAEYALLSDGCHRISFDEVVETMRQTGVDMNPFYRETSDGGLAVVHREL